MYLSKDEWLNLYRNSLSERDFTLLGASYDVLQKNTVNDPSAPWGDTPVISPWSGPCAGIWNWDSAFHAMTVSRFDTELAKSCINAFVRFQLPDGMFPDVIHVDGRIMDNYSKPPVLPWATLKVFEADGDMDFLRRNYERFTENEKFWSSERCDRGLFYYSAQTDPLADNSLHPRWESGWDNSPRWDDGIVDLWPVDLNCYMILFYRSMTKMAQYLGKPGTPWQEKEQKLEKLTEEMLFDDQRGCYADRNRKTGEFCKVLSPASFMPLFVGTASPERAQAMDVLARDTKGFYPGMPTVTYGCPAYCTDYWRGPTWLNVAYFAVKGLLDYGFTQTAVEIREFLLNMIYDNLPKGIYENYDSVKRVGRSNPSFSWSAAFIIEFILNFNANKTERN